MKLTPTMFQPDVSEAVCSFDKHIVCIHKTPEEFDASIQSLLKKAIAAYETRGPLLRHGIALDKFVTIIISQSPESKPLCGIYFNLRSPYQKTT